MQPSELPTPVTLWELPAAVAGSRLVLLSGISGSGKTTGATLLADGGFVIVSADALAWERCGDAFAGFSPDRQREVFALVNADIDAEVGRLLGEGRRVAVDATNCRRSRRDALRALAARYHVSVRLVFFDTDAAELHRRMALRRGNGPHDQIVPPDRLDAFIAGFDRPTPDENPVVVGRGAILPRRHSTCACWHNYCDGIYFVTICTDEKKKLFGEICNEEMHLSALGEIANDCIAAISDHIRNAEILNSVIMPNHVHLVIHVGARYIAAADTPADMPADDDGIDHNGLQSCCEDISQNRKRKYGCLRPNKEQNDKNLHHNSTLATIIGSYKAAVTRQARRNNLIVTRDSLSQSDATRGRDVSRPYKVWQRSFHDRIIRSQQALDNIMFYVDDNVRRWSEDCFRE